MSIETGAAGSMLSSPTRFVKCCRGGDAVAYADPQSQWSANALAGAVA